MADQAETDPMLAGGAAEGGAPGDAPGEVNLVVSRREKDTLSTFKRVVGPVAAALGLTGTAVALLWRLMSPVMSNVNEGQNITISVSKLSDASGEPLIAFGASSLNVFLFAILAASSMVLVYRLVAMVLDKDYAERARGQILGFMSNNTIAQPGDVVMEMTRQIAPDTPNVRTERDGNTITITSSDK